MTEFEESAEESIEMVKVVFRFFSDLFDKEMIETMWCMPLDAELGLYQLDNIPFYAPLMAADDVIFAEKDDSEGGMLAFKKVVESSGNSTIHIVRMEESNSIESILKPVLDLGCNFEGINENYLALDVPSDIQYKENTNREQVQDRIRNYLESGGLFNPEAMEHDKVRDLLIDIRNWLDEV